jgi:transcriptional regulator with XRE-family HTH domain
MNSTLFTMSAPPNPEMAQLVRSARQKTGLSQEVFARVIGRSQAVVSKYESGKVSPPGGVIIHCMNIMKPSEPAPNVAVQASDPRWRSLFSALHQLNRAVEALRPR